MPSALLWFRRDLRLADLPALAEAGADGADVLACYVLDPRLAHAGARRLQFLYDSLRELSDALDGRLLVTRGRPETRIPDLAEQIGATSVHISGEFTPFGVRRDAAVRDALGSVELVATGSPYLVSPGRLTKSDGTPYQVFTPYYRRWLEHGWRAPARTGPASARWIDPDGRPLDLVELGSGDGEKTLSLCRVLHQRGIDCIYRPMDVSAHALADLGRRFQQQLPQLAIAPVLGGWLVPQNGTSFSAPLVVSLLSNDVTAFDAIASRDRALARGDAAKRLPRSEFPPKIVYDPKHLAESYSIQAARKPMSIDVQAWYETLQFLDFSTGQHLSP